MQKRILIVVAHPDDETLMAGATFRRWRREGFHPVGVVVVASGAGARSAGASRIAENQKEALADLGVSCTFNLGFPDSELNAVPHLHLVRAIEDCIQKFEPDIIITHFPGDNHSDHKCVSQACQEAMRWFQRPKGQKPCQELWYGEVPSSTDWGLGEQFHPNTWVEVSAEDLGDKLAVLENYEEVLRLDPHPRSRRNIVALAELRGAQAGVDYAEAFQQVFRVL